MNESGRNDDQTRRLEPGDDPHATRVSDTSRKETGPAGGTPTAPPTSSPTEPAATAAQPFTPGLRILNRYTLKKLLGRGGFGAVWQAHDEELRMDVAIKFLSEMIISNPDAVEDLKRETRYSLRLTHPNIVRTYGFLQSPDVVGIAMEYVPGGTLVHLRAGRAERCFGPTELSPWIAQLCEALDYAHHKVQIIHRDLKPANLMIDDHRDLKVADFGISRSVSDSRTRITNDRDTSGTLAYMSPQQMMGDPVSVTDDVYALGATLYDLLTGKPPFHSGDIVQQVLRAKPPTVEARRRDLGETGEALPPEWEAVLAACLEKEAENRPATAGEVAERLGIRTASSGRTQATRSGGTGVVDPMATRAVSDVPEADATRQETPRSVAATPGTAAGGTAPGTAAGNRFGGQPPSATAAATQAPHPAYAGADTGGPGAAAGRKPNIVLIGGAAAAVVIAAGLFLTFRPKPAPEPAAVTAVQTTEPDRTPLLPPADPPPGDPAGTPGGSESATPSGPDRSSGAAAPDNARLTRLRSDVSAALARKDLDAAGRGIVEILSLVPGDTEALRQKQLIAEWRSKEERITQLRKRIPDRIAAKDFARGEAEINELLALAPGDAAALRWRDDLIAKRAAEPGRTETAIQEPPPATSPPARSTPARPDPPAADPAAADQEAIRTVLTRYERALENLSADQYAALWDGLSGGEKKRLADSFNDLKSMGVDLRIGNVDVAGTTATASVHEARTLSFKAGKDQTIERDLVIRLTKSGDHWKITKLEMK